MSTWEATTASAGQFLDAAASNPRKTLIAMDFDGTLAPIVDDPEASRMLPAAAEALASLGGRVKLAIVTGRAVAAVRRLGELDRRPGLEDLIVLGQYGVERWDAATGKETAPPRPPGIDEALAEVRAEIDRLGLVGVHLEDKGGRAFGVHTRRAEQPDRAFAELRPIVASVANRHALVLEPGRSVLEVRASTRTKGEALMDLVEELDLDAVAMCGDDLGDVAAFEALAVLRGRGLSTCAVVSLSAEQPALEAFADVRAHGPEGVAAWLRQVAHATSS